MSKPRLDPDVLTPRDMQRAKAGPLGGRSAYELMNDPEELFPLIVWCLKSRKDPGFTWEQALDTPFGEFDMTDGGGGDLPSPDGGSSRTKRRAAGSAPSSGSTST